MNSAFPISQDHANAFWTLTGLASYVAKNLLEKYFNQLAEGTWQRGRIKLVDPIITMHQVSSQIMESDEAIFRGNDLTDCLVSEPKQRIKISCRDNALDYFSDNLTFHFRPLVRAYVLDLSNEIERPGLCIPYHRKTRQRDDFVAKLMNITFLYLAVAGFTGQQSLHVLGSYGKILRPNKRLEICRQ
jgi:hypothetical protein